MTAARIAIAGAGMTGAYLYRRLANAGIPVDLYDLPQATACGIAPCAWGTSNGFHELLAEAGLDAEAYILKKLDGVCIDDLDIPADLMTFDKPRLIRDLLGEAHRIETPLPVGAYDRIIDATGSARAFLPPLADELVLECVQKRVRGKTAPKNRIRLTRIGYAWCFPLQGDEYHLGCGSHVEDPGAVLNRQSDDCNAANEIVCGCRGKIRLTSPRFAQPFVGTDGRVWGIGEAVGCVAPLAGDGIVPGMRSAGLLLANWDRPRKYTAAILEEFRWMEAERRVLDRLRFGRSLRLNDAWVLKRNSQRMGMQIGLNDALRLLGKLAV